MTTEPFMFFETRKGNNSPLNLYTISVLLVVPKMNLGSASPACWSSPTGFLHSIWYSCAQICYSAVGSWHISERWRLAETWIIQISSFITILQYKIDNLAFTNLTLTGYKTTSPNKTQSYVFIYPLKGGGIAQQPRVQISVLPIFFQLKYRA